MPQFSFDTQLREEDAELFRFSDVPWRRKHVRAAEDVLRDLQAHGYLQDDDHEILDESEQATVTLTFTADAGGAMTVPEGTRVRTLSPDADFTDNGVVTFLTDSALVVAAGETGTVTATAEHPGEVYNVDAGELVFLEDDAPTNFDGVTNAAAATGGVDHQLTRACVYRAMELVMQDLMRKAEDTFDYKRQMYRSTYKDELKRLVASGVKIDADADGQVSDAEKAHEHGFHRFRRG